MKFGSKKIKMENGKKHKNNNMGIWVSEAYFESKGLMLHLSLSNPNPKIYFIFFPFSPKFCQKKFRTTYICF